MYQCSIFISTIHNTVQQTDTKRTTVQQSVKCPILLRIRQNGQAYPFKMCWINPDPLDLDRGSRREQVRRHKPANSTTCTASRDRHTG